VYYILLGGFVLMYELRIEKCQYSSGKDYYCKQILFRYDASLLYDNVGN